MNNFERDLNFYNGIRKIGYLTKSNCKARALSYL